MRSKPYKASPEQVRRWKRHARTRTYADAVPELDIDCGHEDEAILSNRPLRVSMFGWSADAKLSVAAGARMANLARRHATKEGRLTGSGAMREGRPRGVTARRVRDVLTGQEWESMIALGRSIGKRPDGVRAAAASNGGRYRGMLLAYVNPDGSLDIAGRTGRGRPPCRHPAPKPAAA